MGTDVHHCYGAVIPGAQLSRDSKARMGGIKSSQLGGVTNAPQHIIQHALWGLYCLLSMLSTCTSIHDSTSLPLLLDVVASSEVLGCSTVYRM